MKALKKPKFVEELTQRLKDEAQAHSSGTEDSTTPSTIAGPNLLLMADRSALALALKLPEQATNDVLMFELGVKCFKAGKSAGFYGRELEETANDLRTLILEQGVASFEPDRADFQSYLNSIANRRKIDNWKKKGRENNALRVIGLQLKGEFPASPSHADSIALAEDDRVEVAKNTLALFLEEKRRATLALQFRDFFEESLAHLREARDIIMAPDNRDGEAMRKAVAMLIATPKGLFCGKFAPVVLADHNARRAAFFEGLRLETTQAEAFARLWVSELGFRDGEIALAEGKGASGNAVSQARGRFRNRVIKMYRSLLQAEFRAS